MPGWGGNVLGFERLARYLGNDQPVLGLQSWGLDGKHAPYTRMEDIAAHFVREIREVQPHGPYHLGGLSFGGMVAFEMTRQLEAQGETVAVLALLDTLLDRVDLQHTRLLGRIKRRANFLGRQLKFYSGQLISLPGREKLVFLQSKYKTLRRKIRSRVWQKTNKIEEINAKLAAGAQIDMPPAFRHVAEANFAAIRGYQPKAMGGKATLFRARDQHLAGPFDSEANWRVLVPKGLLVYRVPGDHLTLTAEPNVKVLAHFLSEELRAAK
jgi:thioesterase domain-containing protein